MSGGQQQRVAAARALVTEPAIILADEPTGALDSKNARLLLESIETMNRQYQATVLMVTHDSFAASYTNRVLFIRDGRRTTASPRAIPTASCSSATAAFSPSFAAETARGASSSTASWRSSP